MVEDRRLQNCIYTVEQLIRYVDLSHDEQNQLEKVTKIHPMRISPYYASLIDWNDPKDPIRKMAVPSVEELCLDGSYDTSGESENTKMPGLQHKYRQTALIIATNQCATYCRHCFRKRLVGLPSREIIQRFEDAARYIAEHREINNVLISGGDPFVLSTDILERLLVALANIRHIRFVRLGSRVPVTLPSRFDDDLLSVLQNYSLSEKRLHIVTQFNHPMEITKQSVKAVDSLIKAGVILSNQTVLLKGINDNPRVLANLMQSLVSIGVNPYYVFQCRPVKRVIAHFQVPICEGVRIVENAKKRCNGLSKRFRYVMSHETGKIEILGILGNNVYFKYHQAKDTRNLGKIFTRKVDAKAGWLDDFDSKEQSCLLVE